MKIRQPNRFWPVLSTLAASIGALGLAACGGGDEPAGSGDSAGGTVNLIAYSTPQELYERTLIPGFQATPEGEGTKVTGSFGSSGDQSRAVEAGQPADLIHLALEPDMTRLVDDGIVAEDWDQGAREGILQNSVVAFTVRGGNPKDIRDWDDLVRDDVEVLTPNPFTSGGARWNIMAMYGSQLAAGASAKEALGFVEQVLENTAVQDKSASDALNTFLSGKGDVLISYENESIRAQQAGEDVDYVVPDDTILIETPAAVSAEAGNAQGAQALLDHLLSPEGQRGFAEAGYRPVDPKILAEFEDKFPTPPGLFKIDEFGGWETVSIEFFDPDDGSIAEVERNLGVATG